MKIGTSSKHQPKESWSIYINKRQKRPRKIKAFLQDGKSHCMKFKSSLQQEDDNICMPNKMVSIHMKQKLLELMRQIDKPTIIMGDKNIAQLLIGKAAKKLVNSKKNIRTT